MHNKKDLEKIIRGFSNHRRVEILVLLGNRPDLSVFDVAEILKVNFKTISEHIRRLAIAGLVWKRNDNKSVRHQLSDRGRFVLKFLRTLE